MAEVTNTNGKAKAGNGLGPKTHICTVDLNGGGNLTQDNIDAFVKGVTTGGTNLPPFSVAGISGAVGDAAIYVALQGTATPSTTAEAYATGIDITTVITFEDNV